MLGAKRDKAYREDVCGGYIIKGDLAGAICYVKQVPEQAALYQRYISVFDKEQSANRVFLFIQICATYSTLSSKYGHPDPPFLGRLYIAKGRSIRLDETPSGSSGHGMTAHGQLRNFKSRRMSFFTKRFLLASPFYAARPYAFRLSR